MSKRSPACRSNAQTAPGDPREEGHQVAVPADRPLPRPTRQRRRAKADRGLPPGAELVRLAAEYLRVQRRHWPGLVHAGLLPEATDAALAGMVEDLKHRHRTGQIDPQQIRPFLKFCSKLGGSGRRRSRGTVGLA